MRARLVGGVDVGSGDGLDLGGDTVLGAEVEHLLRLLDAADVAAGERATAPISDITPTESGSPGAPTHTMAPPTSSRLR